MFRIDPGGDVEQTWLDADRVAVQDQFLRDASGADVTGGTVSALSVVNLNVIKPLGGFNHEVQRG